MKVTYDPVADAVYIRFQDTTVTTEHLTEDIAADFDAEGKLAGIEILDASLHLGDPQTIFEHLTYEQFGVGPKPERRSA